MRGSVIKDNIGQVQGNILRACTESFQKKIPQLVAVSKTWPVSDIRTAYDTGQRHFGENYVHELVEKESQLPKDIKWHYIGALQSNKLKTLTMLENFPIIETLNSVGKAKKLDNLLTDNKKMQVYIQVNTSDEEQKNGVSPTNLIPLVKYIKDECKNLDFVGLMTIGSLQESTSEGDINKDFKCLVKCRQDVASSLGVPIDTIELSMGMSHDYQQAIRQGSTNVRVGSAIFGNRITNK